MADTPSAGPGAASCPHVWSGGDGGASVRWASVAVRLGRFRLQSPPPAPPRLSCVRASDLGRRRRPSVALLAVSVCMYVRMSGLTLPLAVRRSLVVSSEFRGAVCFLFRTYSVSNYGSFNFLILNLITYFIQKFLSYICFYNPVLLGWLRAGAVSGGHPELCILHHTPDDPNPLLLSSTKKAPAGQARSGRQ